jgi:predicted transcriptional regulator
MRSCYSHFLSINRKTLRGGLKILEKNDPEIKEVTLERGKMEVDGVCVNVTN